MSRNTLTLLVGIIVTVMPFSGFPPAWKSGTYVVAGLILIILAVKNILRRRARQSYINDRIQSQ